MDYEQLIKEMDFLMSAALGKCGNIQEAEELVQETLLAAVTFLSRGRTIENMRGWLSAVLNRRYYDKIREKYRHPTVNIGIDFSLSDQAELFERLHTAEEAEELRREVAYLADTYREVIVRHYMNGENVTEIAAALQIPEGTVKRRLYSGREQLRKGMVHMKNYSEQSYQPVRLELLISGTWGIKGEPNSLIQDDLAAQNLLWLSYPKPLSIEELSRAIGIPAAYVEPVLDKLVRGELMRRTENKYYADFLITTIEDQERFLSAQKRFVQEHFDRLWENVDRALRAVRDSELYRRCNEDQRNSLELYLTFRSLDEGYYEAFREIFQVEHRVPDRPDGGAWIAMGQVRFADFCREAHREYYSCMWSGQRQAKLRDYGESSLIELYVYGTDGFPAPTYNHCFDDIPPLSGGEPKDAMVLKLLYLLHTGENPGHLGLDPEILRAVPRLVQCRVLRMEADKPVVNIPVLNREEWEALYQLCQETAHAVDANSRDLFREYFKGKKQSVPAHLKSVPLHKRYVWSMYALISYTIREAMKRGRLYDGDYDNPSGENYVPCPMILMIA